MMTILLLGHKNDLELEQAINTLIEGIESVKNKKIDINILSSDKRVFAENIDIIVLKSSYSDIDIQPEISSPIIIDSRNQEALLSLAHGEHYCITCGVARTDTFSLSSISDNECSLSLQRNITALDGSVIEPCEIHITQSQPLAQYPLMVCAAIQLLCRLGDERNEVAV